MSCPRPSRRSVRLTNLLSACDRVQAELAALSAAPDPAAEAALLDRVRELATRVETACRRVGTIPGDLPAPSRRAYLWLAFLGSGANLEAHRQTLSELRSLTPEAAGCEVRVRLSNLPGLYRVRSTGPDLELVVHEAFLGAPRPILRALLAVARRPGADPAARSVIRSFAASQDFAARAWQLEHGAAGSAADPRGRVYNLDEVFARVNAAHFGGRLERPALTWSRTASRRKFGHYQPSTDTVVISATLDDQAVPPLVVEFVVFHELLHKHLGIEVRNGRSRSHTSAFRQAERKFPHYEEAQRLLTELSRTRRAKECDSHRSRKPGPRHRSPRRAK